MSINDYADKLESVAKETLFQTKALQSCRFHGDTVIRTGDEDAERHAYALATTRLRQDGTAWMREDVMQAIKQELDLADDDCPECEANQHA